MGNENGKQSIFDEPHLYVKRLARTKPKELVYSCSFEKWVNGANYVCGFADSADYSTTRDDMRSRGLLLKADTMEGRYLKVHKVSPTKILLEENRTAQVHTVYIPACNKSGKISQRMLSDIRMCIVNYIQQRACKDGMNVIGCRDNLAVVQVLDRQEWLVPEFYFIDLDTQLCVGKFATRDAELMWYECYVSLDKTHVILKTETISCSQNLQCFRKEHQVNSFLITLMNGFPDGNGFNITFDNRHGNRFIFRAKDKCIQLYDMDELRVLQQNKDLSLPAQIRQIRSSPSGAYLALRCAYPAFSIEYHINTIAVILADSLEPIFTIDTKGSFWPVSEVVNLQVFPQFSCCDSAIATMKHGTARRKVSVHKLPPRCFSLQHQCRRCIRQSVFTCDLVKLQLPFRLLQFLKYQVV